MRSIDCLLLASLNKGKFQEFHDILQRFDIKLAPIHEYVRNAKFLKSIEKHTPEDTFYKNAHRKCFHAFEAAKFPTIADDSGLEVDALKGEPGVHSAVYATGVSSIEQDAANRKKVLDGLKSESNRKARFRCVLVFMVEGVELVAEGTCEGRIADSERGSNGFGYDSIFIPEGGEGMTFAQMSEDDKNRFSHRAVAVKNLVEKLKDHEINFVRP